MLPSRYKGEAEPSLGWIERMGQGFLSSGGTADLEPALGWTNAVRQLDLGQGTEDEEHTLGAPERHPSVASMTAPWFEAALGQRIRRDDAGHSQVSWAQGSREDGEGEAEPGYDLPEGDDERCASDHDGCEPSLGSSDHLDQERWADGNGGGSDCELDPLDDVGRCPGAGPHVSRGDLFRLEQRAKDLRRRLRSGKTPAPTSGNLVPVDLRVIGVRGLPWMGGARG